jgi:hypothetical protein
MNYLATYTNSINEFVQTPFLQYKTNEPGGDFNPGPSSSSRLAESASFSNNDAAAADADADADRRK